MLRGPQWLTLGTSRHAYLCHESARTVRIDRIPGAAVDLEIRAHDRAVGDGKEVSDVRRLDPGVGEDRGLVPTASLGLADRVDRRLGARHRTGDEDRVGKTRDTYGARGSGDVARP